MSSMYPPAYGGGTPPGRRCQRCGTPLPPNEVNCRTCGEYNAPMQTPSGMTWGSPTPQTQMPYGGGQYGGQQWGSPAAPPIPNVPYGGTPPPQHPLPNNYYGTANPTPNPNNFYAAPTQNVYAPPSMNGMNGYQPAGMNGYPPTRYDQPPQGKRGPNVGLIIGIVVILLLLVGGGVSGYLFLKGQNHTTAPTVTTPTVVPTPTPSGKLLFSDSFKNNNNGWDLTGSTNNKIAIRMSGGSLVLADNENTLFPEFIPAKAAFSDFQLNVDAVLSKGDQNNGYGVYVRVGSTQNDSLGTYYRFELYGDGTYAIFKGTVDANGNSTPVPLVKTAYGNSIQPRGKLNHITIFAKGSTMKFIVNGVTLSTVPDNSYKSGSMALFVSNVQNVAPGAEATFSNLVIYAVTA
jgi:Domain of Unknown Function (DUF1080)